MGRRKPRPVGDAVAGAMERAAPKTLLASVQAAWPAAVGDAIAAEAAPVAERDGIVTVACGSATWAQELDLMSADLERKLAPELPPQTPLAGLRFSASRDDSKS